jgi:hypothetical protein
MRITLTRQVTGEELIQGFKKVYGSIPELEKLYENNLDNLKLYTDLEDWKYFLENPDEIIEDGKTIIDDKLVLGKYELELIDLIRNGKPESIYELAMMIKWDLKTIYPKIIQLEKYELIELKSGPKRTKIPVVKYDKIEILD